MKTTRATQATKDARFMVSMAEGLEARIRDGRLAGATVEQLSKAAEHWRNQAALRSGGKVH